MSEMDTHMSPETGRVTTARGKSSPRLWSSVLSCHVSTIRVPGGDAVKERL